jgi:hypothetical protein
MLNASESRNTTTDQDVATATLGHDGNGAANNSPNIICDLASGNAFVETYGKPNVPVMSAFGAGRLHACRMIGAFDLDRMASGYASALFRSIRKVGSRSGKESTKIWDDLTFRFGPRAFLYADESRIIGFAATAAEAERLVTECGDNYRKPPPPGPSGGEFHLVQQEGDRIGTKRVHLSHDTILERGVLDMHYGDGAGEWHDRFVREFCARHSGLTIFEGKPGTGKTFYLRHLMGVLRETHRFYFIPTSAMEMLSRPGFVGFWADQRRDYSEGRFVAVLEDADAALMTRGADNRDKVSALLNLSDGMLGDFLRLQIICTINCSAADIDPALLRPGRLLCHRVFGRLDRAQAARLAERLGRELPAATDYSLADIFAGDENQQIGRPRIGFMASRT